MAVSKYETHVKPKLFLIECWARDGYIDKDIAVKLGISEESFYKYKRENTEFAEALKKGKEVIDFEVENALLKRALGYEVEEVKTYIEEGLDGKKKKRIEKTVKHIAGDVTAQIYWTKHRKPKVWTEKALNDSLEESKDDGFIDALNSESEKVWEDED